MSIINSQVGTDMLNTYSQGLGHVQGLTVVVMTSVIVLAVVIGIVMSMRSNRAIAFKVIMPRVDRRATMASVIGQRIAIAALEQAMTNMFQTMIPKPTGIRMKPASSVQAIANKVMDTKLWLQVNPFSGLLPIGHGRSIVAVHKAGDWAQVMDEIHAMTEPTQVGLVYDMWSLS